MISGWDRDGNNVLGKAELFDQFGVIKQSRNDYVIPARATSHFSCTAGWTVNATFRPNVPSEPIQSEHDPKAGSEFNATRFDMIDDDNGFVYGRAIAGRQDWFVIGQRGEFLGTAVGPQSAQYMIMDAVKKDRNRFVISK